MFDLTKPPGGMPGPIYTPTPGNNCLNCHDRDDSVIELPTWGTDGG